jgi:hypothetical protein
MALLSVVVLYAQLRRHASQTLTHTFTDASARFERDSEHLLPPIERLNLKFSTSRVRPVESGRP